MDDSKYYVVVDEHGNKRLIDGARVVRFKLQRSRRAKYSPLTEPTIVVITVKPRDSDDILEIRAEESLVRQHNKSEAPFSILARLSDMTGLCT